MQGWIKLHRKIMDNKMWQEKPFSRGQAWIDLLLMANHDDNTFLFDGRFIDLEKGGFITSEHKLMERWGWSKSKVRLFLNELQKQQMIVKNADQKKTTITIYNYSVYQDSETTERPLKDHSKTTERPLKDPNKNDKECTKNDKENIYNTLPVQLHEHLKEFIEHRKKIKKPMSDHAVRLMLKKLNELSGGDIETSIQILDQSILNGWAGVFPLKEIKSNEDPYAKLIREAMQDEQGRDYRTSKNYQHLLSESDE